MLHKREVPFGLKDYTDFFVSSGAKMSKSKGEIFLLQSSPFNSWSYRDNTKKSDSLWFYSQFFCFTEDFFFCIYFYSTMTFQIKTKNGYRIVCANINAYVIEEFYYNLDHSSSYITISPCPPEKLKSYMSQNEHYMKAGY